MSVNFFDRRQMVDEFISLTAKGQSIFFTNPDETSVNFFDQSLKGRSILLTPAKDLSIF